MRLSGVVSEMLDTVAEFMHTVNLTLKSHSRLIGDLEARVARLEVESRPRS